MNRPRALSLLMSLFACQVVAEPCADTSRYADARSIIEDLGRIASPAGLQASFFAKIGGIDQWVNVRGQDRANPIILFVHGGPASPLIPTLWQFQRPLEEYFTVVNWDQRGSGKTHATVDPRTIEDTLQIDRYVDDAIELAELIRNRYAKDKVILAGHSWGTIVGMHAALKRPDLFHAYVGIGQVIQTRENERIGFEYAVSQAKAAGNTAAIAELASIAPYPGDRPITRERIVIARKWAQFYGGMSAFRDSSDYFFKAPLLSPDYDDRDRCAIDRGNLFTLGRILPEFVDVDFSDVERFPIPVFMFMGRHDYTTPSAPTAAWIERIEAPEKRGIWFERSSHMIPWEEPGKMLVSLLDHLRPLATGGHDSRGDPPAARAVHRRGPIRPTPSSTGHDADRPVR